MNSTMGLSTHPTSNERLAAVLAHAGTFIAWTFAPLIVYIVKKGDSKYVEFQALQSVLWSLLGTVLSLVTCGLAIPVFMVWHVIATVKASAGHDYEYPLVGSFARSLVYET